MTEQELIALLEKKEAAVNAAKVSGDYSEADEIKERIKKAGVHTYDTKDSLGNKSTQYHIPGFPRKGIPDIHGTYVWKITKK